MKRNHNVHEKPVGEELITRKEAILKAGKYAAFTAAAMMLVLAPMDGSAAKKSPVPPRRLQGKRHGF